ncbi:MAG: CBS domain-containing protein [Thaumarchaeota archaeon]|nr:CBS domain-containing protein [Nitrososphaerota archaeon]
MDFRKSLDERVAEFATTQFVSLSPEDTIVKAANLMKSKGTTEALVIAGGSPVGIVTERDILYKVVALGLAPGSTKVSEVMTAPVETVDGASKVGDAIAKMTKLGVRRLGVTRDGKVFGLVTQKNLVSGGPDVHVPLPELAQPGVLSCPYCGATMKDRKELSKHIDQVHLGLGLLEGDLSKW